ncbi:hypothetical protein CIPAW_11G166000 [Carya illinoinensis]|uniref:Uncharacterized protein n=1 Tax=Carya illinoinensis TaxID=32201 RepID=A0A8T1P8F8_CARIL|nr:hypothetical protein CIPAW_11G166000 [Carya illinoinensis]
MDNETHYGKLKNNIKDFSVILLTIMPKFKKQKIHRRVWAVYTIFIPTLVHPEENYHHLKNSFPFIIFPRFPGNQTYNIEPYTEISRRKNKREKKDFTVILLPITLNFEERIRIPSIKYSLVIVEKAIHDLAERKETIFRQMQRGLTKGSGRR